MACSLIPRRSVRPLTRWSMTGAMFTRNQTQGPEMLLDRIDKQMKQMKEDGSFRPDFIVESRNGNSLRFQGTSKDLINFSSNDYFGLNRDEALMMTEDQGVDRWGINYFCRQFDGTTTNHTFVEAELAKMHGTEGCVLFTNQYLATINLFLCLTREEDVIISDEYDHPCLQDAGKIVKAKHLFHKHRNMEELEKLLKENDARFKIVTASGVSPMNGKYGKLRDIAALCEKYDALFFLDDRLGTGIIGEDMKGTDELLGVQDKVFLHSSSLSNAFGLSLGAYHAAPTSVLTLLRQRARPYSYSGGIHGPLSETAVETLVTLKQRKPLRDRAMANASRLRWKLTDAGFTDWGDMHPTSYVMVGSREATEAMRKAAQDAGYFIAPVPPAEDVHRLRITTNAAHDESSIDDLAETLIEAGKKHGALSSENQAKVKATLSEWR